MLSTSFCAKSANVFTRFGEVEVVVYIGRQRSYQTFVLPPVASKSNTGGEDRTGTGLTNVKL